jgi:hypothetical protein
MNIKPLILALALSTLLAGCASAPIYQQRAHSEGLSGVIYEAADRVVGSAANAGLARNKPIIIATSVNVDDLGDSSTFGRLASQLVASRLTQLGYLVRDVTYMQGLVVTPETGEMVLSREASKIALENNAQAVMAGTYAVGGEKIYLNLRMLAADDGHLISAVDVAIPLNEDTQRMIVTGRNDLQRRAALEH